ncbi:MAG: hypothetical protein H8E31_13180 [Planctomycetes bacterium]|nr:hypothetical protein [Planctomycetota bacterium]
MEPTARPIRLPGCKSQSARALVLAAVAEGRSELRGASDSQDTAFLAAALEELGAEIDRREPGVLRIRGLGGPPRARGLRLDAGEAATNFRFLACLLAAGPTDVLLSGSPQLLARPHQALFEFLATHGAGVRAEPDGVRIRGRGLAGGDWKPPAAVSSQFLSGLALAAGWSGEVRMKLPARLPSEGYFDLTLDAIRAFRGQDAARFEPSLSAAEGARILHLGPGSSAGRDWDILADASAATFFLAAAAVRRRPADFHRPWAARHPEAVLNRTWIQASGLLEVASSQTFLATGAVPDAPLEIDLDPAPDAGPALAVLAAALPAGIRFRGLEGLRIKESDRLAGMTALAEAAGGVHRTEPDCLLIQAGKGPSSPPGGQFDPRQDHRLAMAAAVAGLEVTDPACVAKSFPGFWREWNAWSRP